MRLASAAASPLRVTRFVLAFCLAIAGVSFAACRTSQAAELTQTIEQIKPSIVALGRFLKVRSPNVAFFGTGFVVADGRHVVTNAHVVANPLDEANKETRIVLISRGGEPVPRNGELLAVDKEHDIALMRISGDPLPALRLGDSDTVREGQPLAFTGFPLALVLGFHPATHRATVAAIVPVALPGITAKQLTAKAISRIRESVYRVFQLDGTAYPGNSGSPLYDPGDG